MGYRAENGKVWFGDIETAVRDVVLSDGCCVCVVSLRGLLKASQKVDTLMDKFVHYLVVLYEVDCFSVLFDEVFYLFGGLQACHLFAEVEGLCCIQEFYCQDFLRVVDNAV